MTKKLDPIRSKNDGKRPPEVRRGLCRSRLMVGGDRVLGHGKKPGGLIVARKSSGGGGGSGGR